MDPIGIQTIKVDLIRKSLIQNSQDKSVPTFIEGDTNRLVFDLYTNGIAADLSNVGRAVANFKSGTNVYSRLATVNGSQATYDLGVEESALPGLAEVELQLYNADNTQRVTTIRVKVYIAKAIGEVDISPANPEYTVLQELFIEVDDAIASALAAGDYARAQGDAVDEKVASEVATQVPVAVDTKVSSEVATQVPVAVDEKVGQLTNLQTENKTSVVGAVNEVTSQLAEKASQTDLTNAVSSKADKTYVDTELGKKASTDEVEIKTKKQVDFVNLLQNHNQVANELYTKIISERTFDVYIPFRDKLAARFRIRKDFNDDFMKLSLGSVARVEEMESVIEGVDYETDTGAWTKAANNSNWYTMEVGATFSGTFTGTGAKFRHNADRRGGVWEFVIDGEITKRISTHLDAVPADELYTNVATRPLVSGLEYGTHTVTATFLGADPDNPPVTAAGDPTPARGWVRNSSNLTSESGIEHNTFYVLDNVLNSEILFDILHDTSNKEFALSSRPTKETGPYYWLPEHNNDGTVFLGEGSIQEIYFDSELIADWTPHEELRPVKTVKVIQKLDGVYPADTPYKFADVNCIQSFTAKGVSWHAKITYNQETTVSAGYGNMFPVYSDFANKFITSTGGVYDAPLGSGTHSSTVIEEGDNVTACAYLNDSDDATKNNIVVSMTFNDPEKTFRRGQQGRAESVLWLQHRSDYLQKLYPHALSQHTFKAGESYTAAGTFFIGEFPLANDVLL